LHRLDENIGSTRVELAADDLQELDERPLKFPSRATAIPRTLSA
jgi:hypothetical protein